MKFLEEWLENPRYDDKYEILDVNSEMKKVDYLLAATKEDLNEEIMIALREEQNEKNQYGSQYDNLYNVEKMFECACEKPMEDEEESIENDIGNDEFDLKEENCTKDELVEELVEKIFMSWSPKEIGNYYQLMCLHNYI